LASPPQVLAGASSLASLLRRLGEGGAGAGEWASSGFGKLRDWMGGPSADRDRAASDNPPAGT